MAAGVTDVVDHGAAGTVVANLGTSRTISITHAGGGPLLVFFEYRQTTDVALSSVTYDGVAMTQIVDTGWASPNHGFAYRLDDPGAKTANLVITFGASVISCAACSMRATGTGSTGYIDSSGGTVAAATTSLDVTYSRTGAATLSLHYTGRHAGAVARACAADDGQSEIFDSDPATNAMGHAFYTLQESTSGSLTRSATWAASGTVIAIGVSLAPASAAVNLPAVVNTRRLFEVQ